MCIPLIYIPLRYIPLIYIYVYICTYITIITRLLFLFLLYIYIPLHIPMIFPLIWEIPMKKLNPSRFLGPTSNCVFRCCDRPSTMSSKKSKPGAVDTWGFHKWEYPNSWMVKEKHGETLLKWMMTGGTPMPLETSTCMQ